MQIPRGSSLHDLDGADQREVERISLLARTLRIHRRTPIEELGTEAIRFLLEEGKSSGVLLRVAMERLERDPFQGGDFYPGDLLVTLLRQPEAIWSSAPELRARACALAQDAGEMADLLEPEDRPIVESAISEFKTRWMNGGVDA